MSALQARESDVPQPEGMEMLQPVSSSVLVGCKCIVAMVIHPCRLLLAEAGDATLGGDEMATTTPDSIGILV